MTTSPAKIYILLLLITAGCDSVKLTTEFKPHRDRCEFYELEDSRTSYGHDALACVVIELKKIRLELEYLRQDNRAIEAYRQGREAKK